MNEQKLNEIVEQTIAQNESDWPHFRGALTGSGSLYLHVFAEKFAELIVQEMCQVINADCELQYSEGITTNLGGLNQARELIKQHFGVEE